MSSLNEDLEKIKEVEDTLLRNPVARFAYTDEAYNSNHADGVLDYDVNKDQNIPVADSSILKVNDTVLAKGFRAQASSITRMLMNHFLGRLSYNVNKLNDNFNALIETLQNNLGEGNGFAMLGDNGKVPDAQLGRGLANGVASLDEGGRIPYSQLPESAMEFKGTWNASTNTPHLVNGTGTTGDFYVCSVAGTVNFGAGNIEFHDNDRVIYDGSVWTKLNAGAVLTVNNKQPVNGNVTLTYSDVSALPSTYTGNENLTDCKEGTFANGATATFNLSGSTLTITY